LDSIQSETEKHLIEKSALNQDADNFNVDILNLPVSFVLFMTIGWMAASAGLMMLLHSNWSFFESFYFIIITFSTVST